MKIYRMIATFGKLENQTLEFQPGLNVISAPNEWGKTTWCAFLATMLYGLDTREKTTKTSLAAKERYAPWSGSPMSGRIDLRWQDRDITIERWTKGRTPMGEFRAYETESGLSVDTLNGSNCGEVLLGVERSVFLRAGFLRLADLPVTADESLRRRLNALVTTGDESGAADELAQKLKDLKNKCRYNRSGLLPQAELQRENLQGKLTELQTLHAQSDRLKQQQTQLEQQIAGLENHKDSLAYAAAQEDRQRVEQAHLAAEATAENMAKLEEACATPISREEAVAQLNRLTTLQQTMAVLVQEQSALPPEPLPPLIPERYRNISAADAVVQAEQDSRSYSQIEQAIKKNQFLWVIFGGVAAVLLVLALILGSASGWIGIGTAIALLGVATFGINYVRNGVLNKQLRDLMARYPGIGPGQWVEDAAYHAESWQQYAEGKQHISALHQSVQNRLTSTQAQLDALTEGQDQQAWLLNRNQIIQNHDALAEARKSHQQAAAHAQALSAMVKPVRKPLLPDDLTYSEAQTLQILAENVGNLKQLQLRLGQCQGRMDTLGSEESLLAQLEEVNARIAKLNQTYQALDLALRTLEQATLELQRRFAPRIAQTAQALFGKLTGGRYDRLNLQQDLSINTAATDEIAIRSAQWRSDGTIDQLYLALRLAVARELTPDAPLILDDALVRFDDTRHAIAMQILKEEATDKQIILFTCQNRER